MKHVHAGSPMNVALKGTTSAPGLYKITVAAKSGSFTVPAAHLPVKETVGVDTPTAETGQCGEAMFPGLPGGVCALNASGNILTCKSGAIRPLAGPQEGER